MRWAWSGDGVHKFAYGYTPYRGSLQEFATHFEDSWQFGISDAWTCRRLDPPALAWLLDGRYSLNRYFPKFHGFWKH